MSVILTQSISKSSSPSVDCYQGNNYPTSECTSRSR